MDDPLPPSSLRETSASGGTGSAALPVAMLYRHADASTLNFKTTAELKPLDGPVGQQRALGALELGTKIRTPGFNLFVTGSAGSRMQKVVETLLKNARWDRPHPDDWVYVNNFADSR
ncbi:MAG: hypothetical protein R3D82_19240, partial [Xanthobacteraceae bacterium]